MLSQETLLTIFSVCGVLALPPLCLLLRRAFPLLQGVDPIVLCYGTGLILGHWLEPDAALLEPLAGLSVLICIPMMLFNFELRKAWGELPKSLLMMGVFCGLVAVSALIWLPLLPQKPDGAQMAAMITGTFVGSAPNLAAVGMALDVKREVFILTQAADLLVSGTFFIFLMAIGLHWLWPRLPLKAGPDWGPLIREDEPLQVKELIKPFFYTSVIVLSALALGFYVDPQNKTMTIILTMSFLSLFLTLRKKPHHEPSTLRVGEYFFLNFCAATGAQLHFGLLQDLPVPLLLYGFLVLFLSLCLHLAVCYLFNIDRDTFLMTFAAGIFSPAMVAPIAYKSGKPQMMTMGFVVAILGLLLGSFMGILVYQIATP